MPDLIIGFFHIIESYYKDNRKRDIIIKINIVILTFFFLIIEIFMSLVFIEIVQLKFCVLNKNIKKNIEKRAIEDKNITESKKIEDSILELGGYLINLDNNDKSYCEEDE